MKTLIQILIITVIAFFFVQCVCTMNRCEQPSYEELTRPMADTLKNYDKMGMDGSEYLNDYEADYFNMQFNDSSGSFNFIGKKVCFFGPSALSFSNKQKYFNELTKHSSVHSDLYIFNESEKEESGGYDAVIVYWNKKSYTSKELVKRLKEKL